MRLTMFGAVGLLLSLACAGGSKCGEGTVEVDGKCVADDGEADADTDADTDADSDVAPEILSFTTNTSSLTEGESLSFSVVVTDPQGIDDLIGGQLVHPSGGTYGSFATAAGEGAYQLTLSWENIDQVATIEFDEEEEREFEAEFYDAAGNVTRESVSVNLHCNGVASCGGECTWTDSDQDSCGSCDRACDNGNGCVNGTCVFQTHECIPDLDQSCEDVCESRGAFCYDQYDAELWPYDFAGWVHDWNGDVCETYVDANIEIPRCDMTLSDVSPRAEDASCFCGY